MKSKNQKFGWLVASCGLVLASALLGCGVSPTSGASDTKSETLVSDSSMKERMMSCRGAQGGLILGGGSYVCTSDREDWRLNVSFVSVGATAGAGGADGKVLFFGFMCASDSFADWEGYYVGGGGNALIGVGANGQVFGNLSRRCYVLSIAGGMMVDFSGKVLRVGKAERIQ